MIGKQRTKSLGLSWNSETQSISKGSVDIRQQSAPRSGTSTQNVMKGKYSEAQSASREKEGANSHPTYDERHDQQFDEYQESAGSVYSGQDRPEKTQRPGSYSHSTHNDQEYDEYEEPATARGVSSGQERPDKTQRPGMDESSYYRSQNKKMVKSQAQDEDDNYYDEEGQQSEDWDDHNSADQQQYQHQQKTKRTSALEPHNDRAEAETEHWEDQSHASANSRDYYPGTRNQDEGELDAEDWEEQTEHSKPGSNPNYDGAGPEDWEKHSKHGSNSFPRQNSGSRPDANQPYEDEAEEEQWDDHTNTSAHHQQQMSKGRAGLRTHSQTSKHNNVEHESDEELEADHNNFPLAQKGSVSRSGTSTAQTSRHNEDEQESEEESIHGNLPIARQGVVSRPGQSLDQTSWHNEDEQEYDEEASHSTLPLAPQGVVSRSGTSITQTSRHNEEEYESDEQASHSHLPIARQCVVSSPGQSAAQTSQHNGEEQESDEEASHSNLPLAREGMVLRPDRRNYEAEEDCQSWASESSPHNHRNERYLSSEHLNSERSGQGSNNLHQGALEASVHESLGSTDVRSNLRNVYTTPKQVQGTHLLHSENASNRSLSVPHSEKSDQEQLETPESVVSESVSYTYSRPEQINRQPKDSLIQPLTANEFWNMAHSQKEIGAEVNFVRRRTTYTEESESSLMASAIAFQDLKADLEELQAALLAERNARLNAESTINKLALSLEEERVAHASACSQLQLLRQERERMQDYIHAQENLNSFKDKVGLEEFAKKRIRHLEEALIEKEEMIKTITAQVMFERRLFSIPWTLAKKTYM